jgi:lysophospholipase L1-like esterase
LESEIETRPRKKTSFLRSLLSRLALLAFGTLLALLLLEVLLHFYNPLQARIKGNRIVLTTNKTYHIKNDIIKGLDPEITVTRNSIGFRGPNPPADMDKYLSVVTIGGSTTQCFFLSDDQTWTSQLGKELERTFAPVWINNAGLDGHSTHGHLVLLEDFVTGLHPKVAIFLVGANDVARATISDWDAENVKSGIQVASAKAFIKSLSAYSEVVALFLNGYRSYTAYKAGLIHQQIDLKTQGYLDIPEAEQKLSFAENVNAQFLNGYEERLTKIIEVCRKSGIEPVFVTQPLLAGFGTDDVTGVDLARVRAYGPRQTGKMYWEVVEAYNDVTRKVGMANGVLVCDLAREMPKSSRYFYDFIHYTPDGAREIAKLLGRDICPSLQKKYPQYVTQPCAAKT